MTSIFTQLTQKTPASRSESVSSNPKTLSNPKYIEKTHIEKSHRGEKTRATRRQTLASQDFIVIISLGIFCLLTLSTLTKLPLGMPLLISAFFAFLCVSYIRLTRPKNVKTLTPKSNISPKRAAIMGEARLADGFAEAVIIIGQGQRIEHANPVAVQLLGITEPFMSVTSLVRNPDVIDMISRILEGHNCEPVTFHTETPIDKYFRTLASPISSTFGDISKRRALVVFYDVTDIIRSNDLRSDFLANASHELKTPIASLLGYIETMQGHAKDDEAARTRFLKIMQQQAERMQRLIDDLLSLRQIEQAEHIAPTDKADLGMATDAAIQALIPLTDRRHVNIKLDTLPTPSIVIGVHDQLVQLILNLVANALHISEANAHIDIKMDFIKEWHAGKEFERARLDDTAVKRSIASPTKSNIPVYRLRIRDYGRGFDREHIPRIGERFYRVAGDRENKERGTGLGLAIVKHIILGHRGGLYVESARNIGTEFTVLLPAIHPQSDITRESSSILN